MQKLILVVFFCLIYSVVAFSQFGIGNSVLKKKAEQVLKNKLSEKAEERREGFDTLTFNYAIAFLDKTASFENKQKGEGLVRAAGFLIQDDKPKSDLDEARDVYEFGRLNYSLGNMFMAEASLNSAKYSYEQLNATSEPNYYKSIGILGLLYSDMGRFSKAEEFTTLAKEGWLDLQGDESIGYLAELNNYLVLQINMGNYLEAEKFTEELAEKLNRTGEENSLPFAIFLNNQAILNQYMGRSDRALELIQKCVSVAKEGLSENNGTYLQFLTNQAILEQENKQLEKAEETFNKALTLQASRAKLGKKSDPDYAHMQSNLAALYVEKKEYDKAEEALLTALDIYKSKFGENHLTTAETQSDLGNLYRFLEENEKAKKLLQDALYTKERKLTKTHPKVIQGQEDMALWYWQNKEIEPAKSYYKMVMSASLDFIKKYFPALSEAEKTKYWEQLKPRFFRYYNFALSEHRENPELLSELMRYRLATKGILLTSSTALQNAIFNEDDPELQKLYLQWIDQKRQLANAYALSKEEIEEQSFNVDSLERATNTSEKQLSAQSDAFSKAFENQNFDYQLIQENLEETDVLIEIIQYPLFDQSLTAKNGYAFIAMRKNQETPAVVVKTDGDLLEGRYYAYYNNVIKQKLDDQYSYDQFWKPMESIVSNSGKVFISPDGIYNQLNLNTIQKPDGKYVIQDVDIRYIGHPNDILFDNKERNQSGKLAFLIGDPAFNSETISQLPGTKKEIENISKFLSKEVTVQQYMQKNATESNLKKVASPKILHVASHGFFLEDQNLQDNLMGIQLQYIQQNPLLRSGILLTGASGDKASGSGQSFNQEDNGILTAYEAINLNLMNTEMVVLSACETGKGDVKAGEGVYGLQRAFIVAGAQSLVMSMWKVDDTATQKLMSSFYQNRLNSRDVAGSFRKAQLAMLKEYNHPYYWGGFMMYSR
ncbi:CHAT domain-containing protein [Marivirga sp. S37H4]|uniref:CHAT domain-containing protein n=1 Tax=Marivirga aurantiaca TaxID=2802615 RepID=A0A934WUY5_9BACT|nr:CHAT domain-containing protein [Marivirga aurantiaca]MBK6263422.1 CHAT domain-containing protein [Marivirga aurantiaca]